MNKKRKGFASAAVLLSLVLVFFGCENDPAVGTDPGNGTAPKKDLTYTILLDISGKAAGDTVKASPNKGLTGDTVTLSYTVTDTKHYNLLEFSGVSAAIASADNAGSGTVTYSINTADSSSGVITITAVFTHTDLVPDSVAFNDTGHINKIYGDTAFTNAVAGYSGSGVITYSSSDTTVAAVDSSGQVTILKAGSAVISAEKEADAVYAYAKTGYTLMVAPKPVTITGLSAEDKVFDGTTTATVTGTAVISGLVGGDTVTVSEGTAAFADASLGTGKTVTFSGFSLTGADAGNYTLSVQPLSVTANITLDFSRFLGWEWAKGTTDFTYIFLPDGTISVDHCCGLETPNRFSYLVLGNVLVTYGSEMDADKIEVANFTISADGLSFSCDNGIRFFRGELRDTSSSSPTLVLSNNLLGTWRGDDGKVYVFDSAAGLSINSDKYGYLVRGKNLLTLPVGGTNANLQEYTFNRTGNQLVLTRSDGQKYNLTLSE